jgi:arrestin-related trafficking adapter 4/5/7
VEGLDDVHVMYKLKATVARGRLAYDLHAYKPVRIIRTLDPAALELAHAMTVENVWPNKVEYSLQIPQKAVIFGTNIQIEMRFTPLLKGLKIGKIRCTLVETHEWTIFSLHVNERHWKKSRDIANWTFEMNEEQHYQDMINEDGQDGWKLNETLPVPKSLKACMQDVETPGIKIRHKVKFVVALHNPDGHISEVRMFGEIEVCCTNSHSCEPVFQ